METIVWAEPTTYINHKHTVASWLLTYDHKRIGILYLIVVSTAFFLGGIFAALIRLELTTPAGDLLSADVYNRMFTMLSLIHISEPTRLLSISYAVFCL